MWLVSFYIYRRLRVESRVLVLCRVDRRHVCISGCVFSRVGKRSCVGCEKGVTGKGCVHVVLQGSDVQSGTR